MFDLFWSSVTGVNDATAHILHNPIGAIHEAIPPTEGIAIEESSSGGAQLLDKQRKLREQRREARRRAHAEHDTRHFTKGMFWDSVKIQSALLVPMFASSLALSAWFPEAFIGLDIVFVGLGTYIGFEMTEMAGHLWRRNYTSKLHNSVVKRDNILSPTALFHRYKNNLTFKTCVEVGLGVIAGIHHFPLWEQMIIFPLCGGIMMVAPPLMTNTLLGVEHAGIRWAQKLRELNPKNNLFHFVIKRQWNMKLGNSIEDCTIAMFDAMPWFGVLAKAVTSGRLVARGIEPIENAFKDCANNLLELGGFWGATGAVVGNVVKIGCQAAISAPRLARTAVLPLTIAAKSLPPATSDDFFRPADRLKMPTLQRRDHFTKPEF